MSSANEGASLGTTTTFPVILLAAGASRRMGSPKMLLPFGGRPLIRHMVELVARAQYTGEIVVVAGKHSDEIRVALAGSEAVLTVNPDYAAGEMLSSVKVGIRSLRPSACAFFLLPADQPLIQSDTFDLLARRFHVCGAIAAKPEFADRRGHPVLISCALIPEILALKEGDTLKSALAPHRKQTELVSVQDPGVLFDVDTTENYQEALRLYSGKETVL